MDQSDTLCCGLPVSVGALSCCVWMEMGVRKAGEEEAEAERVMVLMPRFSAGGGLGEGAGGPRRQMWLPRSIFKYFPAEI